VQDLDTCTLVNTRAFHSKNAVYITGVGVRTTWLCRR